MQFLRQSTAVTVVVGPTVSIADGITLVSACTVATIDCGIVKNQTAGAAITLAASGTDNDFVTVANNPGHWTMELTTGNTDTVGPMRISFNYPAIFLPFHEDFYVLEESVYDALFAAAGAVPTVAAIADGVWDEVLGTTTGTITGRQALRVMLAKMLAKATGGGTTTITYRNIADSASAVVETVDANGNRSAVTLTVT